MAVRWFRQKATFLQLQANLHGVDSVVNDDGVQETLPPDQTDHLFRQLIELVPEHVTEPLCVFGESLLLQDAKRLESDSTSQGIAAVGRTVLAGLDGEHDGIVGQHTGNGIESAGQGLTEDQDIRSHALVIDGDPLACPCQAGLHLVRDPQDVILGAEFSDSPQISVLFRGKTNLKISKFE